MDESKLRIGSTFFEIKVDLSSSMGRLVYIFIKKGLADYDYDQRRKFWKRRNTYIYYDEKTKALRMPICYLEKFTRYMMSFGRSFHVSNFPGYKPLRVNMNMRDGFKPREHQIPAIKFLTDKNRNRKGLSLFTGGGKTCVSLAALSHYKQCSMIIASGLIDQWADAIDQFMTVREDTYIIKGFKSLERLLKSDYQPTILLCSLETLRAYAYAKGAYKHLIPYLRFLKRYGVGVKVMDEVHLNFLATTNLDLRSNVPVNIYLTATFDVSRRDTRKIFDIVYPEDMLYLHATTPYVNISFYAYNSGIPEKRCKIARGYQHIRFEAVMFSKSYHIDNFVNNTLVYIINEHYLKLKDPGEKMLIFFSTIQMIIAVKERLEKIYPNLSIKTYTAEDPESNLGEGVDIILSTHKSCGTGTDISMLRTCLNTVSVASQVLTTQVLGRLRVLPSGNTPEYVDIYSPSIESHVRHYLNRKAIYLSKAKQYKEYVL